jgi:protoporphyrin/coproporphyrin ferrochelatase
MDTYAGIDDRPLDPPPVDAVLVVGFGGPEGPDDVLPFMENVTRGRGIPPERLAEVSQHYLEHFGGVSPINAQTRALRDALEAELAARGPELPVYWGNRNWHPFLDDALATMRADGRRHALAVVTSAFPSYSGCRQYREDVWRARAGQGPLVTKMRHYYAEEGFLGPLTDGVREQLAGLSAPRLVFTAHSIPESAARTSGPVGDGYVTALRHASAAVADRLGLPWDLVWQSRSGPPSVPWLEPDVSDHLASLYADGAREVVLVPVGFTSDHVEVLYDLDVQARATADGLPGLELRRAPTVGTAPAFVAMLRDLVVERMTAEEELPDHGAPATHDRCPAVCCPAPQRPGRPG